MQKRALRALYDDFADTYVEAVAPVSHYRPRVARFLRAHARPGMRVLDAGCGPGHLTARLPASIGVVGFDFSSQMVERAAEVHRARARRRFFVHDFHEPIPARERFDLVLALGCMEFCRDLDRVFAHLAAVMRPGARMLASVVERRDEVPFHARATAAITRGRAARVTMRLYTLAEMARAIERAGLRAVTYEHAPGWRFGAIGADVMYAYWELTRPAPRRAPRASTATPRGRVSAR